MNKTVLVVDPDRLSRRSIISTLRYGGYDTEAVKNVREAVSRLRRHSRSTVLIVDPDDEPDACDGIERLRAITTAPIIVVSADPGRERKIELLDAGADDYLIRAVDPEELLARVRALIRRVAQLEDERPIVSPDFTMYLRDRRLVLANGTEAPLSPIEWRMIEVLAASANHLVTREDLLTAVWGPQAVDKTQYLRVHIASIRHKIEPDPPNPRYFLTSPGLGLRFDTTGGTTMTAAQTG